MASRIVGALLLGVIGIASAATTCEECVLMSEKAAVFYNDPNLLEVLNGYLVNATCGDISKYDAECETNLPATWKYVAKALFSTDGWFKMPDWCSDLKCTGEEKSAEAVNCWDCRDRMNAQAAFFDDGVAIGDTLLGLQYGGFCEETSKTPDVDIDECRSGMALYVPRIMRALEQYPGGDKFHRTFCKENVKCTV